MRTHAQVEADIIAAREAEIAADEAGDDLAVDQRRDQLNQLLDEWIHIPQPRRASD